MIGTDKALRFNLPIFSGFYESIFELDMDYVQDSLNEDLEEGLIKEAIDIWELDIDHRGFELEVSKACVAVISGWLIEIGIIEEPLSYVETTYPEYYNYSTNRIIVDGYFNLDKVRVLLEANKEAFASYLKRHYTSRDGFISYIDTNVNHWLSDSASWDTDNSYGERLDVGVAVEFLVSKTVEDPIIALYYGLDQEIGSILELSSNYVWDAINKRK